MRIVSISLALPSLPSCEVLLLPREVAARHCTCSQSLAATGLVYGGGAWHCGALATSGRWVLGGRRPVLGRNTKSTSTVCTP
ncbi:hypothetical protein QBC33DRAFT_534147 [Phialemonium atrogriseum]|uniref:Uncharacterized protein n=1 Tax=Phialemonium atrogriseum TaxID=1093897 RepID=A0AAJ0C3N6_9PEZI|nr:uncharacterized protein QBC33DRAFT_534147 [Phialemonium atrogriseum]KAK1768917.1 hypothetical protein QBC33DRAFT_534147 [Phialemonium atrogriseum]